MSGELGGGCFVRDMAFEISRLILERRGIELTQPARWKAIDQRIDTLEIAAGAYEAESREGLYLQASIGASGAKGVEAECLRRLAGRLSLNTLAPSRGYYLAADKEPRTYDRPLPKDRPWRRW